MSIINMQTKRKKINNTGVYTSLEKLKIQSFFNFILTSVHLMTYIVKKNKKLFFK